MNVLNCFTQTRPWTLLSRGRNLIWSGPDPQIPMVLRDQGLFGVSGQLDIIGLAVETLCDRKTCVDMSLTESLASFRPMGGISDSSLPGVHQFSNVYRLLMIFQLPLGLKRFYNPCLRGAFIKSPPVSPGSTRNADETGSGIHLRWRLCLAIPCLLNFGSAQHQHAGGTRIPWIENNEC